MGNEWAKMSQDLAKMMANIGITGTRWKLKDVVWFPFRVISKYQMSLKNWERSKFSWSGEHIL